MRTVIEFLKKKWVIQLLGVIALSLLIWFVGPIVTIAGYVPFEFDIVRLLVILAIVIFCVSFNVFTQLKVNRANAQMLDDLASPSDLLTKETDAEIRKISNNFDEALQTLKKGAKTAKNKNYLYDLPWYIIIGPPGSGKTTALINSGLEFPLADKFGKGGLRGISGTRNCDWWFTNKAVLIDTAGRYVTQDSHEAVDKAAWLGFLNLLKKHRPRRPVNGVLITMSLSDLLKQTEEERSLHAQSIRQRIEELHSQFGIRFPVYMLFTKTDLVAGFNDFFANLSKEEREQVWGVTFPAENKDNPNDVIARIGNDFDDLLQRINDHLPKRLQEERDLSRRNLIFGFPQRMALLRESLLGFLQECYGDNRYQNTPYLRGVYFISGTQEGTPIDRLMGMLANTFKLDKIAVPLFSGKGKSYFITRLLKEVIFDEALIVGVNPRIERLQTLMRLGVYASSLVIITLMSVLWLTSYNQNKNMLNELSKQIQEYETVMVTTPNWQIDFAVLLKRMNAMQAITEIYPADEPWLMNFGLYQGDNLQPIIKETYNELLQRQFLPLIKTRLEQRIKDKMDNPDILYSLLEVYLMLGDNKKLNPDLLRPWIAVDWENIYGSEIRTQAQLLKHLDNLLKLPLDVQSLDQRLIAATRQIFNQTPVAQRIYMQIKNDALQNKAQDFKLLDALGANAQRLFLTKNNSFAQQTIPYLFTYDGFYSVFLKQSKDEAIDSVKESWVLGDTAKAEAIDSDKLEAAIHGYYYQDFIKYWDNLLDNVQIKTVLNTQQATEVLEVASNSDSPLRKLLEILNKETSLTNPPASNSEGLLEKVAAKPLENRMKKLLDAAKSTGMTGTLEKSLGNDVEQHFYPLTSLVRGSDSSAAVPLDRTMAVLSRLYGYMMDLNTTSNIGVVAITKAKQSGVDAVAEMRMESAHLPEPLKSMIQILATGNQNIIFGNSMSGLNQLWKTEILPLYQLGIQGRYPFAKTSDREVTLDDFGHFFSPNGLVDQFFNSNLKAFVDTSGETWRTITQNNQSISVSPEALAQIQTITKLRQLFFVGDGQKPLVKFNLKPLFLNSKAFSFWLNIEGQQIKYTLNEDKKTVPFQWPGIDGSQLVSFGFETRDGKKIHKEIEGQWALFRVLDATSIEKVDQDKYQLTFDIDGVQAYYELSANSVNNPFSLNDFDNIHLPLSL